jgi:hypothetical protein
LRGEDRTNTVTGSINKTIGLIVTPAAADHSSLSTPAGVAAGSAFSVTVTAVDPFGNTATGYTGTVRHRQLLCPG